MGSGWRGRFRERKSFTWRQRIFRISSGRGRLPRRCSSSCFHRRDANVDPLHAGFEVRRSVLGDAHVDKAIAATTDFTREFQELITRYAWGTIWTRPELDRRTRRLLVLAVTASLGRWEEFALHVRAGLASDLELCDLKEVLLQTAVYAGVPAANTGFQIASEQIKQETGPAEESK